MFGKFFASAFTGSMVGAGANVFAVWGYVIANTRSDGIVELNPPLVAAMIGCDLDEVDRAIEYLCSPDPRSRSKKDDGRRLIRESEFLFSVPNYAEYRAIRDEDGRREYMRNYMRQYRSKDEDVNIDVNNGKPPLAQAEAEAEAEAEEKKKTTEAVVSGGQGDPCGLEVTTGLVISGVLRRMGLKGFTMPINKEWQKMCRWAVAQGFTSEDILECYDLLSRQDWRDSAVTPRILTTELPNLKTLRTPRGGKNGSTPQRQTSADRLRDTAEIYNKYPTEAELRRKP